MNDKNNEHVVRAIWLKYVGRVCVDSKTLVILIYFSRLFRKFFFYQQVTLFSHLILKHIYCQPFFSVITLFSL